MALLDLQGLEMTGGPETGGSSSSAGCGVESTASLVVCAASSLSLVSCH